MTTLLLNKNADIDVQNDVSYGYYNYYVNIINVIFNVIISYYRMVRQHYTWLQVMVILN